MIKKYKKQLTVSSIIILLPILVGLILWNTLPDRFATHWGFDGEADGWGTKAFAIFSIPLILLITHWLCFWVTTKDPKAKNQSKKAFGMIFWICPAISLFESAITYALALGAEFNIASIIFVGLGLMFIGIGNYLPKCKQNHTLGIRIPWTLANEENWNATHRFGGKVWVIGGFALLPLSFVPMDWAMGIMLLLVMVMTLIPTLYSWQYFKKQRSAGIVYDTTPDKTTRTISKIAYVFVAVILVIVAWVMFTGDIDYVYAEESFTINASYWNDLTVNYADITDIELRSENVSGIRVWGFGSFRLLLGAFENEEFGNHTRYTYYKPDACVVVTCGENILVLSGENAAATQLIYDELAAKITK